jgi:hypothetical protein
MRTLFSSFVFERLFSCAASKPHAPWHVKKTRAAAIGIKHLCMHVLFHIYGPGYSTEWGKQKNVLALQPAAWPFGQTIRRRLTSGPHAALVTT